MQQLQDNLIIGWGGITFPCIICIWILIISGTVLQNNYTYLWQIHYKIVIMSSKTWQITACSPGKIYFVFLNFFCPHSNSTGSCELVTVYLLPRFYSFCPWIRLIISKLIIYIAWGDGGSWQWSVIITVVWEFTHLLNILHCACKSLNHIRIT